MTHMEAGKLNFIEEQGRHRISLPTFTHQSHVHSANNEAALSFLTAGVPERLQNTAFRLKKSYNFV